MSKYFKIDDSKKRQSFPIKQTLADKMQETYANIIQINPFEDMKEYVSSLRKAKNLSFDKLERKERQNLLISFQSYDKTCLDYYRSDILIANPRRPFQKLECVNYELDSDDSENDESINIDDIDEEDEG